MKALFKKTDSIIYVTIPQKWNKKFTGYPEKKKYTRNDGCLFTNPNLMLQA